MLRGGSSSPTTRKESGLDGDFRGAETLMEPLRSESRRRSDRDGAQSDETAVDEAISRYRQSEDRREKGGESNPSGETESELWTARPGLRLQETSGGLFMGLAPYIRMPKLPDSGQDKLGQDKLVTHHFRV